MGEQTYKDQVSLFVSRVDNHLYNSLQTSSEHFVKGFVSEFKWPGFSVNLFYGGPVYEPKIQVRLTEDVPEDEGPEILEGYVRVEEDDKPKDVASKVEDQLEKLKRLFRQKNEPVDIQKLLETDGTRVMKAPYGLEAIRMLREATGNPHDVHLSSAVMICHTGVIRAKSPNDLVIVHTIECVPEDELDVIFEVCDEADNDVVFFYGLDNAQVCHTDEETFDEAVEGRYNSVTTVEVNHG